MPTNVTYKDSVVGPGVGGGAIVPPAGTVAGDFLVSVINLGPDAPAIYLSTGETLFNKPGTFLDNTVMFGWTYDGSNNFVYAYDDGAGHTTIDEVAVTLSFTVPTGYSAALVGVEEGLVPGAVGAFLPDNTSTPLASDSIYVHGLGYLLGAVAPADFYPPNTTAQISQTKTRSSTDFLAAIALEAAPPNGFVDRSWGQTSPLEGNNIHTWTYRILTYVTPAPDPLSSDADSSVLSIPYKEWAYAPGGGNFEHYRVNMRTIREWANNIRCQGNGPTGGTLGWTVTPDILPLTAIDAVSSPLDARQHEQNYIDIERWAATTCNPLYIPYKEWMRADPTHPHGPMFEQQILSRIQQWATTLGECCVESHGGG